MADVFISYSHSDGALATKVAEALAERGHSIWIDEGKILPGFQYRAIISNGIGSVQSFVPLITPRSLASQNVLGEIGSADFRYRHNELIIIPLSFENAKPPEFIADIDFETCSETDFGYIDRVHQSITTFINTRVEKLRHERINTERSAKHISSIQTRHKLLSQVLLVSAGLCIVAGICRMQWDFFAKIPQMIFLISMFLSSGLFFYLFIRISRCINSCELAQIRLLQNHFDESLKELKSAPCLI